tara:strand:- start:42 stop:800 length:759 start_codon:yes stop_codon:yes gene_type:complete
MIIFENFIFLIVFLVILQSVIGVGILVLGTPIFLIFNYSIPEIMYFLLPISILTSFFNLSFFYFFKNNNFRKKFEISNYKLFLYCSLSIFFGLLFLSIFEKFLNFNLIVAFIILLTIFIKYKYKKIIRSFSSKYKKIILSFISFIHGITNSGGTLLSIFFIMEKQNDKEFSRYSTTIFYLILASLQYLILVIVFFDNYYFNFSISKLFLILAGVIVGNLIISIIKERIFEIIVEFLATFTAVILILRNYFLF